MIVWRVMVLGGLIVLMMLGAVLGGAALGLVIPADYMFFVAQRPAPESPREAFIIDITRSLTRPTNNPVADIFVKWSPTGDKITYTARTERGNHEIHIANADGSQSAAVTRVNGSTSHPAWSPDGARIAFLADVDGPLQLYVVDADGNNLRQLTYDSRYVDHPTWSPDGAHLAFTYNPAGFSPDIYRIEVREAASLNDQPQPIAVTDFVGMDIEPAWSPDGRYIVFSSMRGERLDLILQDLITGEALNLTEDTKFPIELTRSSQWANTGEIVFIGSAAAGEDLYTVNKNGSVSRLTHERFRRIFSLTPYPYDALMD